MNWRWAQIPQKSTWYSGVHLYVGMHICRIPLICRVTPLDGIRPFFVWLKTREVICWVWWRQARLYDGSAEAKCQLWQQIYPPQWVQQRRGRVSNKPETSVHRKLTVIPCSNAANMATPKKRITLSVADKLKMLDRIKAEEPRQKLVAEMGISITLERIVANEAEIRDTAATIPDKSRKRKRTGKNEDVESALGSWFSAVRNKKQTVTGPMLMEKSKDFAECLGSDFTLSTGWLARWKNRMGIKFKQAHREKCPADEAAAENWLMNKLPKLLEEFPETDIFNADETGLFYRATPDSSLCFVKEQLSGSKKALDRITVLVCANMPGTEKKKLLVIGKSKNPRCFKGVDVGKLPVTYRWNTKVWMTGVIFMGSWVREIWWSCFPWTWPPHPQPPTWRICRVRLYVGSNSRTNTRHISGLHCIWETSDNYKPVFQPLQRQQKNSHILPH